MFLVSHCKWHARTCAVARWTNRSTSVAMSSVRAGSSGDSLAIDGGIVASLTSSTKELRLVEKDWAGGVGVVSRTL